MELKIHFTALPQGMDFDGMKSGLDGVLEDDGWIVASGEGFLELELEDEKQNPKYGIMAVRAWLQRMEFPKDTQLELAGTKNNIW